jgi:hypothetical protein
MMQIILAFAAIIELLTGLVLLIYPEIVIRLLFDASIIGTGIIVSRIAGASLIALGMACWPYVIVKNTFQGLQAMLTYSLIATIYLGYLGLFEKMIGILLWPAVVFHSAITIFLVLGSFKRYP